MNDVEVCILQAENSYPVMLCCTTADIESRQYYRHLSYESKLPFEMSPRVVAYSFSFVNHISNEGFGIVVQCWQNVILITSIEIPWKSTSELRHQG